MDERTKELVNSLIDYSIKMDNLIKAFVECINDLNRDFNKKVAEVNEAVRTTTQ